MGISGDQIDRAEGAEHMEIDSAPRAPIVRERPASQVSPGGAGAASPGTCPPTIPDQVMTPLAAQTTGRPVGPGGLGHGEVNQEGQAGRRQGDAAAAGQAAAKQTGASAGDRSHQDGAPPEGSGSQAPPVSDAAHCAVGAGGSAEATRVEKEKGSGGAVQKVAGVQATP
eukprot:6341135-Lingulodinium_polyedra.AAC.1